jgi:RNA polymerase sigma-70 factor (ECF subfamily)
MLRRGRAPAEPPAPRGAAQPGEWGPGLSFERIHEAYRPRIHRYLTRLVGPDDAEDLTQVVFFRVSQALPDFRGDASLATWLYRIARNAAADWRRSTSRTTRMQDELAERAGAGDEQAAAAVSSDDALIRREVQQCVRGVIAHLPDAYRDVLALGELSGLPHAAIAKALGVSRAAVKVRLHRARGRLREVLTARCTLSRDADGVGCASKAGTPCCAA